MALLESLHEAIKRDEKLAKGLNESAAELKGEPLEIALASVMGEKLGVFMPGMELLLRLEPEKFLTLTVAIAEILRRAGFIQEGK